MTIDDDLMPDQVTSALEDSAERMTDESRARIRHLVMTGLRHDSRARYFATISHRVAATIATVGILGTGVAYAANSALPGEPLYALKRGTEDALVAILPPGALEQQLLLGIAERRAGEAADLAIGGAAAGLVEDAIQQVRAAVREATSGEALTEQQTQQIQQRAQDAPQQTREAINEAVSDPVAPQTGPETTPGGSTDDGKGSDTPPGNPDAPGGSNETTGSGGPR